MNIAIMSANRPGGLASILDVRWLIHQEPRPIAIRISVSESLQAQLLYKAIHPYNHTFDYT